MKIFQVMTAKAVGMALVAASVMLASSAAQAATLTWRGAVSTDALNPQNWNPAQPPAPGDTLVVNAGTVVFNSDLTVLSLTLRLRWHRTLCHGQWRLITYYSSPIASPCAMLLSRGNGRFNAW